MHKLNHPSITSRLFHPRPDTFGDSVGEDLRIAVADGVSVGARFHAAMNGKATILFFHGNGEIVADYDELGPVYGSLNIHFLPVDYRGYGQSDGSPEFQTMLADSHRILEFTLDWLRTRQINTPLIVMGRSLGSAPALELARHHADRIDGLIIESGFAYTLPLLQLLGIDVYRLGLSEADGANNLDKIRAFAKPTLIIHAEHDHIIPHADGQSLYDASPAMRKTLQTIPGANHNDIFFKGMSLYLSAVQNMSDCC